MEIISYQLILNILLKSFLWKTSISFSSCLVNVHSSVLYMKTLSMDTLTILTFVLRLVALFSSILVNFAQVLMAKPFLLLMSSSVSSKLPKCLHFFQDVLSFLLMLYSDNFSGISFLDLSNFKLGIYSNPSNIICILFINNFSNISLLAVDMIM